MKNFKILYLIMAFFLTIRCSNDDNVESSTNKLIIGDWTMTNMSINSYMTGNESDIDWIWVFKYYPIPVLVFIENQVDITVNFSKSKQLISHGNLKTSYVAFVDDYLNAYEYSKDLENVDVFKNGEWTLDDAFLTVISNGSIEKYLIIELTNDKLTILKYLRDNVVLNNEYGNIDCTTNLDIRLTFQKN